MTHYKQNADSIRMEGGRPLEGTVRIQGSKNASLPLLAACLLIPDKCVLEDCPDITDVDCMSRLIACAGGVVRRIPSASGLALEVNAGDVTESRLPAKYVSAMRSSVILMGALLGRLGEVYVDYPGGCVIGERPIDLHLYGLECLGAQIWTEGSRIHAYADELVGAEIRFPSASVGATQNTILAAVTARGTTVIRNAAREPEIVALCDFLNKAGADITLSEDFTERGKLVIKGVELSRLHGVSYRVAPDRIVAGTYLFAGLAAGGRIVLENTPLDHLESVCGVITGMGGLLSGDGESGLLTLEAPERGSLRNLPYIETRVYPGFPTDLQSQLMAAACVAKGSLTIKETVFSSRFKILEELRRMGAEIALQSEDMAVITGGAALEGRNVIAKELRGGAALVIAGLAADGITTVSDICYINRGYQDIVEDFARLGARISYD
ncbi:MAG: UDP-N-acetylglucosamine 1-carboxyvinyltransferase [Roseburia sp.]|nr:UDP-N-acetylglucosamine 1-carboxyvinyltransferase [Roseburia sp.]